LLWGQWDDFFRIHAVFRQYNYFYISIIKIRFFNESAALPKRGKLKIQFGKAQMAAQATFTMGSFAWLKGKKTN